MPKKNSRACDRPTIRRSRAADGYAAKLHKALTPMADGCAATAILAYDLATKTNFSKNAAMAVNLAGNTLAKINELIADGRRNKDYPTPVA